MFCQHCRAQIPDGSKFCSNCGGQVTIDSYSVQQEAPGTLRVSRQSAFMATAISTKIFINGEQKASVGNADTVSIPLEAGQYTVELKTPGNKGISQSITISPNTETIISFQLSLSAPGFHKILNISNYGSSSGAPKTTYGNPTVNIGAKRAIRSNSKIKKPIYRKPWFWVIIVIVFIAIVGNSGNSDSSTTTSTPKPTATAKPTPTPTPTPTPVPVFSIGDTVSYDGFDFTVKNAVFSQYAGNLNGLNKADSDYVYCVVYMDVTNTTNEKKTLVSEFLLSYVSDYTFTLVYDGEVEYGQSFGEYTDFLFGNEEILPLATLTNKVLSFRVPVVIQTSNETLDLKFSVKSDERAVWSLR